MVALLFLSLYVSNVLVLEVWEEIANRQTQKVNLIFQAESERLLDIARQVSQIPEIIRDVEDRDSLNLASVLNSEVKRLNVGFLMAIDKDGLVLIRTHEIGRRGDQVFETTPWGREASAGREVVTIGQGRTRALVAIAAYPIMQNGRVAGAVFAGQSLDDESALSFQRKYLNNHDGNQVIYYSGEKGYVGSSFQDPKIKGTLQSYFNTGS